MNLTPKQLKILNFIRDFRAGNGYSPTLEEIARNFGVSKITIFEHLGTLERKGAIRRTKHLARSIEVCAPPSSAGFFTLPMAGYIAAGHPLEAVQQPDFIDISEMLRSEKEQFVLRVRGDSMIDEHIRDGDFVIIERRDWAQNGETVVALLENGEATLKKFYRDGNRFRLQPANPGLKPLYVKTVQIQGVVIGILRKYS